MSSSSRRLLLGLALAAVAGCGFSPAYAPGGAGDALVNRIEVSAPATRAGYLLTQELETRLGRTGDAPYVLTHQIALRRAAIAITSENVASRINLLGEVAYTLRDRVTGATLASGRVESFTSYSASGTPVANQAAERDAEARLMTILADQLITRLLAEAPGLPE